MRCSHERALKTTERPELRTGLQCAMQGSLLLQKLRGQRDLRSMSDARHPGTIMASDEIKGRAGGWWGSPSTIIALSPGKRGRAKTSGGIIARVPACLTSDEAAAAAAAAQGTV